MEGMASGVLLVAAFVSVAAAAAVIAVSLLRITRPRRPDGPPVADRHAVRSHPGGSPDG